MPSKLKKVQKQISKKKGSNLNSLHENSRDALRLRRAEARDDRVSRVTAVRQKVNQHWLDRVAFFQARLPDTLHPMELDRIKDLVNEHLSRHDEELEKLQSERRPGRPASNRQRLLEQQLKMDGLEYESGFWLPDLQDAQTLIKLDAWRGDYTGLALLRFVRVEKFGEVKESQFPPRGAS